MFNDWGTINLCARMAARKATCDVRSYCVILGRAALEHNEQFQVEWR